VGAPHDHAHDGPRGHGHTDGHTHDEPRPGQVWHEEAHDGVLEHASLRLTSGAISLFVNIGVELDGRFSARVETLGQCDEVTGLRDPATAKQVALERARQVITRLGQALDAVLAASAGEPGNAGDKP
jgi:hypothetical protein